MELKEASYTFKNKKLIPLFYQTHLELQTIFLDLCSYCEGKGLPRPTITSIIRPRLPRSISNTHMEGRAMDIRSRVYSREEIDQMVAYINGCWSGLYGTAPEGKPPRCLVFEDIGANSHLHLQVKR